MSAQGRGGPAGTHGAGRGRPGGSARAGRLFGVRARVCARRLLSPRSGLQPRASQFEWRAARLPLCPGGDGCWKWRRRAGRAAPSLLPPTSCPSCVCSPAFAGVRLQSRALRPSLGWKKAQSRLWAGRAQGGD